MKLPKEKIKSISFQLPAPARRVLDAREDLRPLAQGADRRAMDKAIDCYALVYQGMLAKQMELGEAKGGIKQMQKEIEGTKFQIKGSSTKGDTAT